MIMRESFSYRVPLIGSGVIGLALLAVLPGWSRGQQIEGQVSQSGAAGLPTAEAQPGAAAQTGPAVRTIPAATSEAAAPGGAAVAGPQPQPTNLLRAAEIAPATPAAQTNLPSAGVGNSSLGIGALPASNQQGGADQKIQEIEARLAQLLAEIQQLRGSGSAPQQPQQQQGMQQMMGLAGRRAVDHSADPTNPFGANSQAYRADKSRFFNALRGQRAGAAGQATDDVETLTRAKYKLSQPVADAARAFIENYFKRDIGAKVDGDVLTVIASPEDQQRISAFVELLRDSDRDNVEGTQQVN